VCVCVCVGGGHACMRAHTCVLIVCVCMPTTYVLLIWCVVYVSERLLHVSCTS
jgi:hypothetical protein